jgi:hypothetical protein
MVRVILVEMFVVHDGHDLQFWGSWNYGPRFHPWPEDAWRQDGWHHRSGLCGHIVMFFALGEDPLGDIFRHDFKSRRHWNGYNNKKQRFALMCIIRRVYSLSLIRFLWRRKSESNVVLQYQCCGIGILQPGCWERHAILYEFCSWLNRAPYLHVCWDHRFAVLNQRWPCMSYLMDLPQDLPTKIWIAL